MKKAVILLDVQEDFLGNTLDYIAPLCQRFLNEHASEYDLVLLTHFMYDEIKGRNTLLLRHEKANVVGKTTYSAYTGEVRQLLRDAEIEEVHVGGVDAEMSVLATMFSLVDAGYHVKILERLIGSYHGRNWESMMIARHCLGAENVIQLGGDRVYV